MKIEILTKGSRRGGKQLIPALGTHGQKWPRKALSLAWSIVSMKVGAEKELVTCKDSWKKNEGRYGCREVWCGLVME
jgi:hypothetical protein